MLLAVALAFAAEPAAALTTTQIHSFSGSPFDAIAVTPFAPSLGTLNTVHVNIFGTLAVLGTTLPNLPGGIPIAYPYEVDVNQSFLGLGSQYFDLDHGTFRFVSVASGVGEPFAFVTAFSYDFQFTAASDLIGFTFPSVSSSVGALLPPLPGITGMRSDFVATGIPINEIDLLQQFTVQATLPVIVTSFQANGLLEIDFGFTPVPEPASGTLLCLGLALSIAQVIRGSRIRHA
jgi:hypothetical protein